MGIKCAIERIIEIDIVIAISIAYRFEYECILGLILICFDMLDCVRYSKQHSDINFTRYNTNILH